MKLLFVASGNSKNFNVTPFIKAQGKSLEKLGIKVDYFPVLGKGIKGYLKSGRRLQKYLNSNKQYDIIHAHYSLSGWSALIGSRDIPIVLSLMGSDTYGIYVGHKKVKLSSRINTLLTILIQPFVNKILSKSKNIEKYVYLKHKSHIVPNGIILNNFTPKNYDVKNKLNLSSNKQYILFLGDKSNIRKNYNLVKNAYDILDNDRIDLLTPYPIPHHKVADYLCAADVIVLTSYAEGSPNVIKEAMACNAPIVSTNVGDVKWLLDGLDGCYIASFEPEDFAEKIRLALQFSEKHVKTKGRKRLIELGLDSRSVARKIINIYGEVL